MQKQQSYINDFKHLCYKSNNIKPKSLGILLYMYCNIYMNHEKYFTENDVINHFRNVVGRTQIQSAFRELQNKGYLKRHLIRVGHHHSAGGQYRGSRWTIRNINV